MNIRKHILDRKALLLCSVFLSIISMYLLIKWIFASDHLILMDRDSGDVLFKEPVNNHDRFSLTYTHSVERTDVTEIFEIIDGTIFVMESHTESFGAGLPYEGTVLERDGKYVIKDIGQPIPTLVVRPSNAFPHYFRFNNHHIIISDPPFKGLNIEIKVN